MDVLTPNRAQVQADALISEFSSTKQWVVDSPHNQTLRVTSPHSGTGRLLRMSVIRLSGSYRLRVRTSGQPDSLARWIEHRTVIRLGGSVAVELHR
jgi:hypothetical protein